jgi:hypothetical protein
VEENSISLSNKNIMHEYFTYAVTALVNSDGVKFQENYNNLKGYTDREQFAAYMVEYAQPLVDTLDALLNKSI